MEIEKYPEFWKKFHRYYLPEPADSAIVSLLEDRVNAAQMKGKSADYPQIAAKNDCTFRNIVENLQIAKNRNLTVETGQFAENLTQTWREKYSQAVRILRRVGKEYPLEILVGEFFDLGNALYGLSRFDDAIASWDKAIEFKPDKDEAWDNRGVALNKLGKFEEALASHQQALRIQPQSAAPLYNLACTYALQGDTDKAIEYLQQAIDLEPNTYNDRGCDRFQILLDNT